MNKFPRPVVTTTENEISGLLIQEANLYNNTELKISCHIDSKYFMDMYEQEKVKIGVKVTSTARVREFHNVTIDNENKFIFSYNIPEYNKSKYTFQILGYAVADFENTDFDHVFIENGDIVLYGDDEIIKEGTSEDSLYDFLQLVVHDADVISYENDDYSIFIKVPNKEFQKLQELNGRENNTIFYFLVAPFFSNLFKDIFNENALEIYGETIWLEYIIENFIENGIINAGDSEMTMLEKLFNMKFDRLCDELLKNGE